MAISSPEKQLEPKPLPKSPTEAQIATHIESVLHAQILAINTRHFHPSTAPWTHVAADFSMPAVGFRHRATTREEYVAGYENLALAYPKFEIELVKMETQVWKGVGYAETYLTAQSCGGPTVPVGMKRKAVGRYEFRRVGVEGRWVCVGEQTFLGIGDGGAG